MARRISPQNNHTFSYAVIKYNIIFCCGDFVKLFKFSICFSILILIFNLSASALDTSAKAAVVINADTLSVIYSHNIDERLPMASTTKIMTALLLAEQKTPERIVTATKNAVYVEGSSMGLKVGDTVSFNDLLYGILLPSGNDAANLAAISIAGTTQKFAELMNNKAREFGLHNTNFVTPSGLDAAGHYTSAYDLAVITAHALKNDAFSTVAATYSKRVKIGDREVTLTNHNKLLKNYDGCIGVKTGYTSLAGRCLVSAARRNGVTVIAVTLNDRNDWNDHISLLDYGLSKVKKKVVEPQIPHFSTLLSAEDLEVELFIEPLEIGLTDNENIEYTAVLRQNIFAPIEKGEVVGFVEYSVGEGVVRSEEIVAAESLDVASESVGVLEKIIINFVNVFRSI